MIGWLVCVAIATVAVLCFCGVALLVGDMLVRVMDRYGVWAEVVGLVALLGLLLGTLTWLSLP